MLSPSGHKYIFLPVNSSDYNPIEHVFNEIKSKLQRIRKEDPRVPLVDDILKAAAEVTRGDIEGVFRGQGYMDTTEDGRIHLKLRKIGNKG